MAIKADNLVLNYGETTIIDNVSLEIPAGSFCTIIGPNGCGKSTLLKALSRNLKTKSGSIFIMGKSLKHYDTRLLSRKLAFLVQSPFIPDQFSVRDLVSFGRFPYSNWLGMLKPKDHDVITRAMELTQVQEFADRELLHLSGGERQRVWIAMALAQEAEILLLDEPTTYLDIAHQFQTLELIYKLHKEMGQTILMVLHDLNQAARYSDYIFVLKNGKLFGQGNPEEIITEDILKQVFSLETRVIKDRENNCPYFIPLRGLAN